MDNKPKTISRQTRLQHNMALYNLFISNDGMVYNLPHEMAAHHAFSVVVRLYNTGKSHIWGHEITSLGLPSQQFQDLVMLVFDVRLVGIHMHMTANSFSNASPVVTPCSGLISMEATVELDTSSSSYSSLSSEAELDDAVDALDEAFHRDIDEVMEASLSDTFFKDIEKLLLDM